MFMVDDLLLRTEKQTGELLFFFSDSNLFDLSSSLLSLWSYDLCLNCSGWVSMMMIQLNLWEPHSNLSQLIVASWFWKLGFECSFLIWFYVFGYFMMDQREIIVNWCVLMLDWWGFGVNWVRLGLELGMNIHGVHTNFWKFLAFDLWGDEREMDLCLLDRKSVV